LAIENKVDEKIVSSLLDKHSVYSNKFYITRSNSLFRITFCEGIQGTDRISVVSSVTISMDDFLELGSLISIMTKSPPAN